MKRLLLGTATWGWTVPPNEAYRLLDAWLGKGYRHIDAATNYPINKNPADFRASEKILLDYVRAQGLTDLEITMKVGSLNNMRTPEINLAPSFLYMMAEEYQRLFGPNLQTVMLHWDNRDDASAVGESLEALHRIEQELGLQPGLSGIRHPEVYAQMNEAIRLAFHIQFKHNVLQSDLTRYAPLIHGASAAPHQFFAYGINAGGLKLAGEYPAGSTFLARGGDPEKAAAVLATLRRQLPEWNLAAVRPPIRTLNQIGLIHAGLHPGINGILLGVSSVSQLEESLDFWRNLETFDYSDVYSALQKMTSTPT